MKDVQAGTGNGKRNGAGKVPGAEASASPPPPKAIAELAEGCVRFVERAVGLTLDYQPETLPLVDHYIEQARASVRERPEMLAIVAHTCGAYLGEVVRRRYAAWWRAEGDDPSEWQVELESVFLAWNPVRLVLAALRRGSGDEEDEGGRKPGASLDALDAPDALDALDAPEREEADLAELVLEEEDRAAVAARLAELPPVSEEEFYAPSTRIEVIDIAVEAIRARRMASGEEVDAMLRPEDYERAD